MVENTLGLLKVLLFNEKRDSLQQLIHNTLAEVVFERFVMLV